MTLRTVQDASSLAGTALTAFTPTGSDTVAGGPNVKLIVNNGNAASCVIVLATPEVVEGTLPVGDRTVTVPTTQIWEIPIPARYNDPITGVATLTFSVTSTVSTYYSRGNPS
jgi:hypothetical protein